MAYEDYRREVRDDINVSNGNTTPSGNLSDGSSTGKKLNDTLDILETYYANVLDSASLNMADPIGANIGFFNNTGKVMIDGPKLGRTLVFMTRPNLNLRSIDNVNRCKIFKYLTSSKLGFTLARQLMYSEAAAHLCYGGLINDLEFKHNLKNIHGTCDDTIVGGMSCIDSGDTASNGSIIGSNPDLSFPVDISNFIPLITNCCKETSNAKDLILETEETEGDYAGNKLVYGSGMDESLGPGEITLSFDDLYGSPVMNLMIIWVYYIHYVTKGIITPELEYIKNRIIDYTCSIYVFMLDTDQRTIIRWIKYTGCFPKTIPFGQILHSSDIKVEQLSQIQIPFQYNFASPMDPTVLAEFNMISEPALYYRSPTRAALKDYTKTEQRSSFNISTSNPNAPIHFFNGKNHMISMDEANRFMYYNPPIYFPKRLLNVSDIANKVDELDYAGYNKYVGTDAVNTRYIDDVAFYGEHGRVPTNNNPELGEFGQLSMTNRYFGQMNQARNYGQPYIVDGNKLMFL